MKVIAVVNNGNSYIVEVGHSEIEKCMGKYYNKLHRLAEGAEIDLSEGYDFRNDIVSACDAMVKGRDAFDRKWESLLNFAKMVATVQEKKPE